MAACLIALSGPAGSGKSEAASYLQHGYGFKLVKFAGPLKAMLRAYYRELGVPETEIERRIEGDLKEVPDDLLNGQTPRHAMETLGTEWGRTCMGEAFWINAWKQAIRYERQNVVTDDCRFDNEAEAVKAENGVVVQLKPKVQRRKKSKHAAERGVSAKVVDHVIQNDEGIGKLREQIDNILFPRSQEIG